MPFYKKDGVIHHFTHEIDDPDYQLIGDFAALDKTRQSNFDIEPLVKARKYLDATEFYISRKLETGAAIPREVSRNRDKARNILAENIPEFDL
jgi:hypothetical protein